jgi:hypothetical protein
MNDTKLSLCYRFAFFNEEGIQRDTEYFEVICINSII